jgi:DNA-binding NarL/FixJ family response regulator
MPPLIVIDGSDDVFEAALAEARRFGWTVTPGFDVGVSRPRRIVRFGAVRTSDDAAAALMAALSGAGIVIASRAPSEVMDRLVGDLRHVGPVDHRPAGPAAALSLGSTEGAVLRLLAEGLSLGEAATRLGLSRRTADRRLADARRALGAERTAEAIARARRLKLLG